MNEKEKEEFIDDIAKIFANFRDCDIPIEKAKTIMDEVMVNGLESEEALRKHLSIDEVIRLNSHFSL